MGRRSRRRDQDREPAGQTRPGRAPQRTYADAEGNELTLRGTLTAGSRRLLAQAPGAGPAAATREDTSQRIFELLFERLATRWVIAGAPLEGQRELLGRLRMASAAERDWVRRTVREHCAEHFPDVQAP